MLTGHKLGPKERECVLEAGDELTVLDVSMELGLCIQLKNPRRVQGSGPVMLAAHGVLAHQQRPEIRVTIGEATHRDIEVQEVTLAHAAVLLGRKVERDL